MLILSRNVGQSIVVDGRIVVRIMRLEGDTVKLGIEAPPEVPVHRQEIYDEIRGSNREAIAQGNTGVPRLLPKLRPVSATKAGETETRG
ncbi:MAG TPA: carbon storage regulator CsrA [Verrucomicrobiae bacterium]|nr:carbon storage regulator CsrA [Verrucomicrobiae bacterium]